MCGKPMHSRTQGENGEWYCYMDGFCDIYECRCPHTFVSGDCDCKPVEHDCQPDEDGWCYDCTILEE